MGQMLVWLDEVACHDRGLVGGKAANLSRLMAEYPIPLGFCLTSAAFMEWAVSSNGVMGPASHQKMLASAYQRLGKRCQIAEPRVAVRSSAIGEDGQMASFAGQYETYLNLVGTEAVGEAVTRVWASAHSARVQSYSDQRAIPARDNQLQVAVLVQHLVPADVSAVAFSVNPITGNREEIVINASWGLGESIVSGTVTPDTYVVCKKSLQVIKQQIAQKERMTVMVADGVQEVAVPRLMSHENAISMTQVIDIARVACALEEQMTWPVDIECAYQNGTFYLLQCRPITTFHPTSRSGVRPSLSSSRSGVRPSLSSSRSGVRPSLPTSQRAEMGAHKHEGHVSGAAPALKPLPVPPNFPVKWNTPSDATLLWRRERLHFPNPVAPLDFSFRIKAVEAGLNYAADIYGLPFRLDYQQINSYVYNTRIPRIAQREDAEALEAGQERLKRAMFALERLWNEEWLPEIKLHLAYWDAYPLQQASLPALLTHLNETETRVCRLYEIHFLLFLPIILALSSFEETYQGLFNGSDSFEAYELLGGFSNKTVESGEALWALSRQALASPAIHKILSENQPTEIAAKLAESPIGRTFWHKVQDYLQKFGQRSNMLQLNYPCWLEKPTPVIERLQKYMLDDNDRNPTATIQQLAIKREQRIVELRQQLTAYPQPLVTHVERLLHAAQISNILSEEHTYWIDCQLHYQVRNVCLEFGRRFADANLIEHRDDVFYMTLPELKKVAETLFEPSTLRHASRQGIAGSGGAKLREHKTACQNQILARKATEERFADCTPPLALGTMKTIKTTAPPDHLLSQAMRKFFGGPSFISETTDELKGYPGAPGIVQGTAKVIQSFDEASKLNAGDILVTPTTTPPWSPLFATAAAVVTETGGILSHTAIVAREYGIPAVVGTGNATTFIKDGQTIEVNGNSGLVGVKK